MSTALKLLPGEDEVKLHAFVDRSIVEVFAMDGRSAVTARVYPTRNDSVVAAVYAGDTHPATLRQAEIWNLRGALASP
jgi:beta-fructofuranosidase